MEDPVEDLRPALQQQMGRIDPDVGGDLLDEPDRGKDRRELGVEGGMDVRKDLAAVRPGGLDCRAGRDDPATGGGVDLPLATTSWSAMSIKLTARTKVARPLTRALQNPSFVAPVRIVY